MEQWFEATRDEWSARDLRSVNRTLSGLTKLIFSDSRMTKDDARLLLRLSLEPRLRLHARVHVRVQLHTISPQGFPLTHFTYTDRESASLETVDLAT